MPHLHLHIANKKIPAFHFWVLTGLVVALLCCPLLAWAQGLSPLLTATACLVGFSGIFIFAMGKKILTGKEVLVFYQYYFVILLLMTLFLWAFGAPVLAYLDILSIGVAINLAFGRLGCYSVGCCHGRPKEKGVLYGAEHVAHGFPRYLKLVPLFPIQLLSFLAGILIALACTLALLLGNFEAGSVLAFHLLLYASTRFFLELFRGDADRLYLLGFSEAQWIGFALVLGVLFLGQMQIIPSLIWYWAFAGIYFISMLIVHFIQSKKATNTVLSHPPYVKELMDKIALLQQKNTSEIQVINTSFKLNISFQQHHREGKTQFQYSCSGKLLDNSSSASSLAKLLQKIRHPKLNFELVEGKNDFYHILFA